ncbi:MAG: hypothetical protein GY723_12215, partial [bacterium]|nr:hypothetical protein [bacterium]
MKQSLVAKLGSWPDSQLKDAVRLYRDDYEARQLKAILQELTRRGIPIPASRSDRRGKGGVIAALLLGAGCLAVAAIGVVSYLSALQVRTAT